MKLIFVCFSIVFLGMITSGNSQAVDQTNLEARLTNATPQEMVYLHVNTTFLFPGEYLLYKIYTLNKETKKLSEISQIAYVELIGEKGQRVFNHKVKLERGRGQADYFIPTNIPSGNYKLVGYTNWMKNVESNYFEIDITIINPYQSQQVNLLAASEAGISTDETSKHDEDIQSGTRELSFELNKNRFQNREQVLLNIKSEKPLTGNFSISVRKVSKPGKERKSAESFMRSSEDLKSPGKLDSYFLPELRGQLFRGRIKALKDGVETQDQKIALSIPSEYSLPVIGRTGNNGEFYFNLDKDTRGKQATIEVLGENKSNYEIELFEDSTINYPSLEFDKFRLTPEMEEMILERSIHNQIENAFFRVKPDTLKPANSKATLLQNKLTTYNLDDYTRFKTIPETFVEIINSAWIRRDHNGKRVFEVRGLLNSAEMERLPMVVIDGLLIQDHSDLIYLDAFKVQNISIIRDKLYLGPEIYQGAILVETINEDFFETYSKEFVNKIELKQPEIGKRYFQQSYEEDSANSRIPDFRYQLLWQPTLDLESFSSESITFYTSDVTGDFEIILEGFTSEGRPVSLRKVFSVE